MTTPQKTLSHLSTTYLITLYIGGNPYLASDEDPFNTAFIDALEAELARRGIRSLDTSVGWDVSKMPDEDLLALEDYLGGIWADISNGMLKTIAEGWDKKRQAQKESALVQAERD